MASLGVFRVRLIVAVVALYALSFHGCRAANNLLKHKNNTLRVDLIRRDSPISPLPDAQILSNAERMHRAIQRSHNRRRRLQHYTSQNRGHGTFKSYSSPVNYEEGEFLMQMAIGSPVPSNLHFILDTGSDLIWTQCQPCGNSCVAQNDSMYDPFQSSSYTSVSCSNSLCSALNVPASVSFGFCDFLANCRYYYEYGDLSYTSGVLGYETFSLGTAGSRTRASFPHLSFGCGRKQSGDFSNSAGIIGLGRGPLSLVSQIGSSFKNIFSYCLGSVDNASQISSLFLGKAATLGADYRATPLVPNNHFPTFYYLGLDRISVAGKTVPIPKGAFQILEDGSRGLVIDSGSTITSLEDPGYMPFLNAVRSSIPVRPVNASDTTGFDLCYNATPALRFPTITFHFAGGAKFVLPKNNSFIPFQLEDTGGVVCLAFASAGPAGSTSIFGNVQQQNFHIVYDLGHNNLYFAPTNCASVS